MLRTAEAVTYQDAFDPKMWSENGRAANYSKLGWSQNSDLLTFIVDELQLRSTDVVIDMATGNGVVAQALLEKIANVVVFDISPAMMANIKPELLDTTHRSQASITELPYATESADALTARMVFHHLNDAQIELALVEAMRVLKPTGKFMVIEYVATDVECLALERQVFDIKEKDRQLWTAEGMEEKLSVILQKKGVADQVAIRTETATLPQYSVMNWLKNANMVSEEIEAIMELYINSSQSFQEKTKMTKIFDDSGAIIDLLLDRVFAHVILEKR